MAVGGGAVYDVWVHYNYFFALECPRKGRVVSSDGPIPRAGGTGRKESPFPHSHHALSGHSPGFVCVSGASVAIVAQARERSPIAPPFEPEKSTPRTKRFGRDFTNTKPRCLSDHWFVTVGGIRSST